MFSVLETSWLVESSLATKNTHSCQAAHWLPKHWTVCPWLLLQLPSTASSALDCERSSRPDSPLTLGATSQADLLDWPPSASLQCKTSLEATYWICQQRILDLINELIAISENENCNNLVITGEINFVHANCEAKDPNDCYELNVLNLLSENDSKEGLSQNNKKQLDTFLTNNPNILLNYTTQNEFNKSYRSDYLAYTITIHTGKEVTNTIQMNGLRFIKPIGMQ